MARKKSDIGYEQLSLFDLELNNFFLSVHPKLSIVEDCIKTLQDALDKAEGEDRLKIAYLILESSIEVDLSIYFCDAERKLVKALDAVKENTNSLVKL